MRFQALKARFDLGSAAALLVIVFGLVLRLRQLTLNLSFWLDEAMLALNIVNRSFAGLIRPLDYDQGAPLGFLWAVKALQSLLGDHEYSLRLLPFLAGCLSLYLLWKLARQLIRPVGVVFVLLVFASSYYLVSYTAQVKQYAVDGMISLFLQLLALGFLRKNNPRKDYFLLAVLGALAIWMSHAAVFTLGAVGLVLFGAQVVKKDWQSMRKYALVGVFWMLNFLALYLIQYRFLTANSFLTNYWAEFFMPLTLSAPEWVLSQIARLFSDMGGMSHSLPSAIILVLIFGGGVSLARREKGWTWMYVLSLVLTLAASSLQKYPFGGRMAMFLVPGLLICVGESIELLRRLFAPRPALGLAAALALTAFLTYTPLSFSIETALKPKMTENIAPTMAYIKTNLRPGDVIYLYHTSIPAYRYYAPKYGLENLRFVDGKDPHQDIQVIQTEVSQLAGNSRVWFLFSHLTAPSYIEERDSMLGIANQLGEKKREFRLPGTQIELYLYNLGAR